MRLPISPILSLTILIPLCLAAAPSYFYITKPSAGDQWTQGQPHAATWIHAVDGVDVIDVEIGRLSTGGLLLAAREVPTRWGALNLMLGEVPPADDYYLIFLNVTHGLVYSISDRFTILAPAVSSANNSAQIAPDDTYPTVTVTGAPGPTMSFAATFGPQAAGAVALWRGLADGKTSVAMLYALVMGLMAGIWVVL